MNGPFDGEKIQKWMILNCSSGFDSGSGSKSLSHSFYLIIDLCVGSVLKFRSIIAKTSFQKLSAEECYFLSKYRSLACKFIENVQHENFNIELWINLFTGYL